LTGFDSIVERSYSAHRACASKQNKKARSVAIGTGAAR